MDSLRKTISLKSSQQKQKQKEDEHQILLSQRKLNSTPNSSPDDVKIKINSLDSNNSGGENNANRLWKDTSYDLSKNSILETAAKSREFDFLTESPLPPRSSRVSFNERVSTAEPDEVLACSSNKSFRRKSTLKRSQTKSRLIDPPEQITRSKSNQTQRSVTKSKSQVLSKGSSDHEEEDPFLEEDLPEDFKRIRFNAISVMQLVSLILLTIALIGSLTIDILKRRRVFDLELWKWVVMALVLISGRLVAGCGIRIVVFFIERNFLLRKRVLYFVYGLKNAAQNCVWLTLVLIAWQCIFDNRVKRVTPGKFLPYVTKIWVCLLVGTLIWLVKTLLVKVLASSFHVTTYFDRIQESLFIQYVIETLSGPPLIEIYEVKDDEETLMVEVENLQKAGATIPPDLKANIFPRRVIGTPRHSASSPRQSTSSTDPRTPMFYKVMSNNEEENGITIDHLHRLNRKNISAWNMKRLMKIVRNGVITTLDEKIQDSTGGEDEQMGLITSENQAKVAAKKIFINVAKPGSKNIYAEDLTRFMRDDEVENTMSLFHPGCEQKGISRRALKDRVVNAFRERRALALSLNDTKTAVNTLHHMLNIAVVVVIIIIWLLILKVATTHFFIFLSSQLLLVVFMFGNTCKTTFESIIFLFVMHPFDVGDRIEVDEVQMVVEEMNILTTVLLKFDNHKIYYPNSVLSTKPIHNYYRSPDMGDAIDFSIHISTPTEKIASMKQRITSYVDNMSEHWYPSPMIVMRDVEDMNRLKWSVWLSQKMNFQDMGERWVRRALLVEEMVKIFRELDIEYRVLPHDVNIRNAPPLSSSRLPSNWKVCAA